MRRAFRISWENHVNTCKHCDGPVIRKGKTGPNPTYCGIPCRSAAGYERSRSEGRLAATRARVAAKKSAAREIIIARVGQCIQCGTTFSGRRRDALYCSKSCAMRAFSRRRVEDGRQADVNRRRRDTERVRNLAARQPRTCIACGDSWLTNRAAAKYCSFLCRDWHRFGPRSCALPVPRRPRATPTPAPPRFTPFRRDCDWCGDSYTCRSPHGSMCGARCKTRASRARRRARIAGTGGTYTWSEVVALHLAFDRRCAYCDERVTGQPDPDHVVPLSRGGHNSITNILPCCRSCNSDKRNLLLHEWAQDRARLGKRPVRTSWEPDDSRFWHLTSALLAAA